eukprot:TRINITY_DN1444_c0_g1_i6.p1 TRINITY_DN1444_c0_g1~~TRINITY_DN1444_c0_g1_i6.p1  ORF type:complete len:699 (-),score=229.14 TRINITY_DN1444_c0_g1_i6:119-2131(-)
MTKEEKDDFGREKRTREKEHYRDDESERERKRERQERKDSASKLQDARKKLPIYPFKDSILEALKDCSTMVIIGETGSGKTTQISQFLYEAGYADRGMIGITQPRRVAAVSVAHRVADELGTSVGHEVGYAIRFTDRTSPDTRIKYMTDGTLLRECLIDPDLKQYSVIVLDEAHERSVHTDILFGLMKKAVQRRKDLKLLVTSATLETDKFSQFFDRCPIYFVPGRTFPVDTFYQDVPGKRDYVDECVDMVLKIHEIEEPGDILVFLTGQSEIERACSAIKTKVEKLFEKKPELWDLLVLPLYAALPPADQVKVFEPAPEFHRKVVIATNIAETSLTVEGIVYVVDPGYVKQKGFNPRTGMESLDVVSISQVAAAQRAGRAGRTRPGKCYRLYTKSTFDMLDHVTVPEIQRSNLANTVLTLKALGIQDVIGFDFLDPPDPFLLVQAMKHLLFLGAVDENGRITPMGTQMSSFPLEPSYSRMLIESVNLKCSQDILSLIAMMSVENLFYRPNGKKQQEEADEQRTKLFLDMEYQLEGDLSGDHFFILYLYKTWRRQGNSGGNLQKIRQQWCKDHYIQPRHLEEAHEIRKQLEEIMNVQKLELISVGTVGKNERICKSICSGLFMNSARKISGNTGKTMDPHQQYAYLILKQGIFQLEKNSRNFKLKIHLQV